MWAMETQRSLDAASRLSLWIFTSPRSSLTEFTNREPASLKPYREKRKWNGGHNPTGEFVEIKIGTFEVLSHFVFVVYWITWWSASLAIFSILHCRASREAPRDLLIALSTSSDMTLEVPSQIGKTWGKFVSNETCKRHWFPIKLWFRVWVWVCHWNLDQVMNTERRIYWG